MAEFDGTTVATAVSGGLTVLGGVLFGFKQLIKNNAVVNSGVAQEQATAAISKGHLSEIERLSESNDELIKAIGKLRRGHEEMLTTISTLAIHLENVMLCEDCTTRTARTRTAVTKLMDRFLVEKEKKETHAATPHEERK